MDTREKGRKLGDEKILEKFSHIQGSPAFENIKKFTEKLLNEADKHFLEAHKEELSYQEELVEFLHKFTNEKFVNYKEEVESLLK